MRITQLVCVVSWVGAFSALAIPHTTSTHTIHETRPHSALPREWTKRKLPSSSVLPLRIGLKQQNTYKLEELLLSVSHPSSPEYGKHWTPKQVVDYFRPSEETVQSVVGWLEDEGIERQRVKVSGNGGWVEVKASVEEVESLLKTEYHAYEHPSGAKQIGCESYSLPEHIREHVDLVKPTVHFNHRLSGDPVKRSQKFKRTDTKLGMPSSNNGPKTNGKKVTLPPTLANCDEFITLDCLRALYSIDYTPVASDKNSYGIVEFTPQAFLPGDLDLFFANFSPSQVGQRPNFISIDGGVAQTQNQSFDFNGESDLDLEYAMGLTNPLNITLLQTGDLVEGAGFDNWLDAVDASFCTFDGGDVPGQDGIYPDDEPGGFNQSESCGIIAPPNVVSTSYGQDEVTATVAYATRQCTEYGKLGMMGTTVLYSTGDSGVAGNGGCITPNGTAESTDPDAIMFNPDFPAGCPFITAVGATQVSPNMTVFDPESACEQVIFSGGGFSNIFNMPSYQADAVTSFLTNHPPPYSAKQFNNSGTSRAFPDLSANGYLVFGTSASSPVVGSIIALINDARIAAGKGPVGFINPAIYSTDFAGAFHDITNGTNQGCGTVGFTAVKGWDPVTGVGTPNMTALMPLFLALP
ncbi:uncharacterized protein STEHIDRAFT_149190 [Stereum hirsutum FP-91666 SS1]|uniref:uncharacterized protein n=1 Tax=Stereum hirsutum (strain FP-91666) TaxID=721885 RepID=UPI000444A913|nr:uncharacterized protein STEHIDRAFT_149190 [Stereum hirsutum FP-91666 SS1]EIM82805.1 hypothetical protein STEHIDRAFT_149190 [Stereum hirsutum FP-91666 SS1]